MMEDEMTTLKNLKFATLPKLVGTNPTLDRRTNIIRRLEEQKLLLANPKYTRTVKTEGVEKQQKVRAWWQPQEDGSYLFFVRVGFKPVEFSHGKNAIVVPSLDKISETIDVLIDAVRQGELDNQLVPTTKKKSKAAA